MSEPKSIYDDRTIGLPGGVQAPDNVARWTNPTTGKWVMNNEPLSTKQLHELIVSQSMTIDACLTKNGELVDALKRIKELMQKGQYIQVNGILRDILG